MVEKEAVQTENRTGHPVSGRMTDQYQTHFVWIGFILPLFLTCAWEWSIRAGLSSGRLMPAPSVIFQTLRELVQTGELQTHCLATLARIGAGFALGAFAGTLIGAISGASVFVRSVIDPTLQSLRAVPSIAWVPLFILWMGIFETSKIVLIAVGVFFPVYLGVVGAIIGIDRKLIEVGRVFRLTRWGMIRRVMLPAVMPEWVTALRSGLGLGFMFVVAAEFMGASEGLGFLLVDGQQMGKPAQILGAIIIFAILGKISDAVLLYLTRPLLVWQDTVRESL
jgi:sulfonate transport system permease protein